MKKILLAILSITLISSCSQKELLTERGIQNVAKTFCYKVNIPYTKEIRKEEPGFNPDNYWMTDIDFSKQHKVGQLFSFRSITLHKGKITNKAEWQMKSVDPHVRCPCTGLESVGEAPLDSMIYESSFFGATNDENWIDLKIGHSSIMVKKMPNCSVFTKY